MLGEVKYSDGAERFVDIRLYALVSGLELVIVRRNSAFDITCLYFLTSLKGSRS